MTNERSVWGPWSSLGFTLLVWVVYNLVAFGVAVLFVRQDWLGAARTPGVLDGNGLFLSITVIVNAVVCGLMVLLFIALRRGLSVREYLALHRPGRRALFRWLLLLLPFLLVSETLGYLLGRPPVPEFMLEAYATAHYVVLLWFAVAVAAPVFEELLFRGFLQRSLMASRFGVSGAILMPALIWTVIHLQYDLYDLTWVFVFGVMLGLARWRTGALFVPLAMHMTLNLLALAATAVLVARGGGG